MLIAITGASGFLGQALCTSFASYGYKVRGIVRPKKVIKQDDIEYIAINNIGANTNWSDALLGVDCVLHLAARAHVMNETGSIALDKYRAINVEGTRRLAKQALACKVKRFIYLSSIKVNGETTSGSNYFTSKDIPKPEDPYGISKWEAEQVLWDIAERTNLEVVVVRPTLIYGQNMKGNLLRLFNLVASGLPLPLGSLHNKRSLISLDNLADLLIKCVHHQNAKGQTLLASDNDDISITELLHSISIALGKPSRLIPIPANLLKLCINILGKKEIANRILENLQVDISETKKLLDWQPPISISKGLDKTAKWYLNR